MYSPQDEEKSVIAGRFIRTLKNKIYKTSLDFNIKKAHIDKLDILNEYNNTYHRTIKMKPVDLKIIYILTLLKKLILKTPNLKFVIML